MNIFWLKRIRKKSWNKYEIQNWNHVSGCKDKPWHICDAYNRGLAFHEYRTREEAINELKRMWHTEAEKFLWENRSKRKRNKYPW